MEKLTDRKVIMDLLELLYESDGVSPLIKSYIRVAYNGLNQVKHEEIAAEAQKRWELEQQKGNNNE